MTSRTLQDCENLIDRYVNEYKGTCISLSEGVLGLGKKLLYAEGKKFVVITEKFQSSQSCTHNVLRYNKVPKKYQKYL